MKNYQSVGMFVGSLIGAVITGVVVYFTGSVLSAMISPVCLLLGGLIGKEIKKPEKK
ncbi:MAG: hypothetical protein IJZ95_00060 [Oscillospiraceae bacterium]|nr:hypothetical protein [Oscillospiraceae bacterium]